MHLHDAIAMNARIAARSFTALSRLDLAHALAASRTATDAVTEATEQLQRATAEFRRLDMPGPLADAHLLAEQSTDARDAAWPLTARETEIADLVARALSNREIANHLVLSERTVESHVRSILNKLGLRSRTEIATRSLQHPPRSPAPRRAARRAAPNA